jgi:hypothetical protein
VSRQILTVAEMTAADRAAIRGRDAPDDRADGAGWPTPAAEAIRASATPEAADAGGLVRSRQQRRRRLCDRPPLLKRTAAGR